MKRLAIVAALLTLAGCATPQAPPLACAPPLQPAVQVDLYMGRGTEGGREVSDAQWSRFVSDEVTQRFPDGLSVLDVAGQWRDQTGRTIHEKSKLLIVVVFDAPAHVPKIEAIVDAYKKRFAQQAILRVEKAVCAGV